MATKTRGPSQAALQAVADRPAPAARANGRRTLRDMLMERKDAIAELVPRHLNPDRLLKVALMSVDRNPDLAACSTQSLIRCVLQCAELGLDPGNALGGAYLVPYKGVATLIVGYRGYVELARRSGAVSSIEAHVVYARDAFTITYGLEPQLRHEPYLGDEDRGELRAVYAIARFKDDAAPPQFDHMIRAELEKAKASSQTGRKNVGPWRDWYEEMARKTVVRRLIKYLPMTPELQTAADVDDQAEVGRAPVPATDVIDLGGLEAPGGHEPQEGPQPGRNYPQAEADRITHWRSWIAGAEDSGELEAIAAEVVRLEPRQDSPVRQAAEQAYEARLEELRGGDS